MSDWHIRTATAQDIPDILSLWRSSESSPAVGATVAGLDRLIARSDDALLIAECDGRVVGSVIATWDGWRGSFYRLAVSPERRREGIATALVAEGERRLRGQGAVRLTAIVADDDATAIAFWQAGGFERQPDRARFVRELDR